MVDILLPSKLHPIGTFILWFIGIPAKQMVWKDEETGKEIKYRKAHDGQATYREIEYYLKNCGKADRSISRSTIHRRLKELEEAKMIKNVGPKDRGGMATRGKAAAYKLTREGELAQRVLAEYYDFRIELRNTPGVLGFNKDSDGQLYFLSMIRLANRQNVDLIKRAMEYVSKKHAANQFLEGLFAVQRWATLVFCSSLINPGMKIAMEDAIGNEGIKRLTKTLSDFTNLLLGFK